MPLLPTLKRRVTRPSRKVYPITPPDSPDPAASSSSLWVHVRGKSLASTVIGNGGGGGGEHAPTDPATDAIERANRRRAGRARNPRASRDERVSGDGGDTGAAHTPPTTPPTRILQISAPVPVLIPAKATVDLDVAMKHRSLDLSPSFSTDSIATACERPQPTTILGSASEHAVGHGDTAAALLMTEASINEHANVDDFTPSRGPALAHAASLPGPGSAALSPSLSAQLGAADPLAPPPSLLVRSNTMPSRPARNPTRPSRHPARPSIASSQSDPPALPPTSLCDSGAVPPDVETLAPAPSIMSKFSPRKGSISRSTRKALGMASSLALTPATGSIGGTASASAPLSGAPAPAHNGSGSRSALAAQLSAFEAVLDAQLQAGRVAEPRYLSMRAELRRMVEVVRDEGTSELAAVGVLKGYVQGVYAGARGVAA